MNSNKSLSIELVQTVVILNQFAMVFSSAMRCAPFSKINAGESKNQRLSMNRWTVVKCIVVLCMFFDWSNAQTSNQQANEKQDDPDNKRSEIAKLWSDAQKAIGKSDYEVAEKKLSKLIELSPDFSSAIYYRGRVRFQAGDVKGSVADFDRHIKLSPELKSRQWERGISLYYARKFKEGAKQFEIYQTYHDNDVENSAWRFLCVAQTEGMEAARKNLLPIRNDRRVPMMQIYAMFQGKMTPQQVLEAAEKLPESERQSNSAKFYANLYVGLYYEVKKEVGLAEKHLKVARKHRIDHYMWNVADVHLRLLKKQGKPDSAKDSEKKKSQ